MKALKFKIDENLPAIFADDLRAEGHDALTVDDEGLSGVIDPRLAKVCQDEARAIVTEDTDFANIVAYPPATFRGIVVLRTRFQGLGALRAFRTLVLPRLATEPLDGHLWVVDDVRVRVRG